MSNKMEKDIRNLNMGCIPLPEKGFRPEIRGVFVDKYSEKKAKRTDNDI